MHKDIESIVYSEQVLADRIAELGKQISEDYKGKKLIVVGVMKGANVFVADLIRNMDLDIVLDFIVVSSYGASTESTGVIRLLKDLDENIDSEHVLIVEDIIDSGLTLEYLVNNFETRHPESIRICTLLNKVERRKVDMKVDYIGFQVPDEFIVGYGIDYAERYRNLPYVGILKRSVYE
ncbi:hypoxanthine phosphoribosyltransferase [Acidaminobacter sp. JC074]|uniref:hypoxanthine phosphoribosyltransferase n=1 Tax=Acidaminobacter sp. JC074 TaxID=2530199 RepID=UPI001F1191C8|nr:hypoxanthine phosphoribosyltransferase [Acidaminobacter sp. JC074]MCH4890769.1 hypoxanthine phosphoribosyltransferase [Acidaminobacter sp. JC074]